MLRRHKGKEYLAYYGILFLYEKPLHILFVCTTKSDLFHPFALI